MYVAPLSSGPPGHIRLSLQAVRQGLQALQVSLRTQLNGLQDHSPQTESRATLLCVLETLEREAGAGASGQVLFQQVLNACFEHQLWNRTFAAFLYVSLKQPLTDRAVVLLQRLRLKEEPLAVAQELVDRLMEQLVVAVHGAAETGSPPFPTPEHFLRRMFRSLSNDVNDYARSAYHRLVDRVSARDGETQEHAWERMGAVEGHRDALKHCLQAERGKAFFAAFARATGRLSARHRNVLYLREVEGWSVEAIAAQLQERESRVTEWLQYGREKRAILIMSALKSASALDDLSQNPVETLALLKRERLWYLVHHLAPGGG